MNDFLLMVLISPFVGSFLGVVIIRLPRGEGLVTGRSKCPDCGHILAFWHLIPLVSYVLRWGKCGFCGKKISLFYPVMELAALLVVLWVAGVTTGVVFMFSCLLGWWLLTLAVIDWRHFILPDILTWPLMVAGLAAIAHINPDRLVWHLAGVLVAGAVFGGLMVIYRYIRHREGLGGGDVKLFAAGGAWVGLEGLGSMLLISTLLALAVIFTRAAIAQKKPDPAQKVPFGTYLSLGLMITWLYGPFLIF